MGTESPKTEQFYRYTDATGRVHIVSSPHSLPAEARGKAERVELNADLTRQQQTAGAPETPRFELNWPSFGIGFGVALLLALLYRAMPQNMRWVSRLAFMAGLAIVGGGLYFGYLQRVTTGASSSSPLASPSALINDAKAAVEQAQARRKQQDAELEAIKNDGASLPK